jgi:hypothetical protein
MRAPHRMVAPTCLRPRKTGAFGGTIAQPVVSAAQEFGGGAQSAVFASSPAQAGANHGILCEVLGRQAQLHLGTSIQTPELSVVLVSMS